VAVAKRRCHILSETQQSLGVHAGEASLIACYSYGGMRRHSGAGDSRKFIDEIRAKQRNIVFPDVLANGAAVDKFLLKGSPNPSLIQRVAAWLFGLMFLIGGVFFLDYAQQGYAQQEEGSLLMGLVSIGFFLLGAWVFRNGFRRRKRGPMSKKH
jgi:hypothetical protein